MVNNQDNTIKDGSRETNTDMVNDQDNTKMDGGDVTIANAAVKGKEAHKYMVNDQDNTKVDGDDVTIANDDVKGKEAHKCMVKDQINIQEKTHKSKLYKPKRKPNKDGDRKMIGKALEILIVSCMKNHVYKFGNQLKIQSAGGPIGLALTGEVADCVMIRFDKQFTQKCKDVGINLTL